MGFYGFLAEGIGAAIGAWLSWWLSIMLNPVFPPLALGTLAANLIGGSLVMTTLSILTVRLLKAKEAT